MDRGLDRRLDRDDVLGAKARWGLVGYDGDAHAPARGTYLGIDPAAARYTTFEDSGAHPRGGPAMANLHALVAACLYEVGFACEFGPLSTWSN